MTLGQRIYTLRSEHHLSQGELSDLLNVSRQSVSKWENDTAVPDLDKLIRLCDVFGVSLDELTGRAAQASDQADTTSAAHCAATFPGQKPLGYVLLSLAFLTVLFLILLGPSFPMFIMFAQPLLLCSLILLFVRHHTGYWCLWCVYLSVEYTATFVFGQAILTTTLLIRFIFIVFMILIANITLKDVNISISKPCGYRLLFGWIAYLAVSWCLPRIFYLFPTRFWFDFSELSQMLFYYFFNALATIGLAFLLRSTICCLRKHKKK